MMKHYSIYIFSQEDCVPCKNLKKHVGTLNKHQQAEITFVPMKTLTGEYTAFAEELNVLLSPTLVVVSNEITCEIDPVDFEEYCTGQQEPVERYVGAKSIIENLDSTLDAYTYCNDL